MENKYGKTGSEENYGSQQTPKYGGSKSATSGSESERGNGMRASEEEEEEE